MKNIIRFSWCFAHKRIKSNEMVDQLVKNASLTKFCLSYYVTYREIMFSFKEYLDIDTYCIEWISKDMGSYYMSRFRDIKIKYLLMLT